MSKTIKKGLVCMLVGGLFMNTAVPALAADTFASTEPTMVYEQQTEQQHESRIVVSYPATKTVIYSNIDASFRPPSQIEDTRTVDGITYTGVLYYESHSMTDTTCYAKYSGVLYAVI